LFYYSGHGTQLPENIALTGVLDPEQDGVDEALYVYDGELLDDEIGVLLDRLPAENIIVIFDSCFSGAGTRDASGKVKEVPFASVAGARPKSYIGAKNGKSAAHWRGFAYQVLQTPTRHVFLAASDEDQLSW